MIDPCIRRAARCTSSLTRLLVILSLFFAAGITFAAAVGDQVELKATHQAGVPFHQEPRGTDNFKRIPDGTRAHVIDVAKGGQCKPRQNILYSCAQRSRLDVVRDDGRLTGSPPLPGGGGMAAW
jgi:hypothetical protein